MSITRNVQMIPEESNYPFYKFKVEISMNGTVQSGVVHYEHNTDMGRFHFNDFERVLKGVQNPNSDLQVIKHLIRELVKEEINRGLEIREIR